jgi:hypothetical protein
VGANTIAQGEDVIIMEIEKGMAIVSMAITSMEPITDFTAAAIAVIIIMVMENITIMANITITISIGLTIITTGLMTITMQGLIMVITFISDITAIAMFLMA